MGRRRFKTDITRRRRSLFCLIVVCHVRCLSHYSFNVAVSTDKGDENRILAGIQYAHIKNHQNVIYHALIADFILLTKSSFSTGFLIKSSYLTSGNMLTNSSAMSRADTNITFVFVLILFILENS